MDQNLRKIDMQRVIAFLQLVRFNNLLIMLATIGLSYYCLTDYLTPDDLLRPPFLVLCCSILLTAAAGNIINDYLDVNIDLTNKPDKVIIGKIISRRWAMLLHFVCNGLAILMAFYLKTSIGLMVMSCTILLWLYSVVFKKQFLTGNLVVALLSALVIITLALFNTQISGYLILVYATFAFGISLIREIIKDTEDMRGDSKFDCKTLPITIGIRRTKKVLYVIIGVYIALLLAHLFIGNSFIIFRHEHNRIFYAIYMLLAVLFPLILTMVLLFKADVKHHFTRLSSIYKIIMVTGILSMLLIKL